MGLSEDLAKEFAKAVKKDDSNESKSTTSYGTVVTFNGKKYVRLDGSDRLTPVNTTVNNKVGDRVSVELKNHSATITGNVTAPAANSDDVKDINNKILEVHTLVADKADIKELDAQKARIDTLEADNVTIKGSLTSSKADIKEIKANNVAITGKVSANEAAIKSIKADKLDVATASATYATIENLQATNADIHNLSSTFADFKIATADQLTSNEAAIKSLQTDKLDAASADIKYANIDFTNITKAAMKNFYAESGLIKNVTVGDQTITGELIGVTISGDLIEGNTIVADKLVIKGEDGLYYKLNTDGVSVAKEQTDYNSLNGTVIKAKSVTADKVSVTDLVAFGATIAGFQITDNSIYSGVKETVGNTTRGIYLDKQGQFNFGDEAEYVKYYKDQNGSYKLEISVDDIKIDLGKTSIASKLDSLNNEITATNDNLKSNYLTSEKTTAAITANNESITSTVSKTVLDNLNIGGRNLLLNTNKTELSGALSWGTKGSIQLKGCNNQSYNSGTANGNTIEPKEHGYRVYVGKATYATYWINGSGQGTNGGMGCLKKGSTYTISFDWSVKAYSADTSDTERHIQLAIYGNHVDANTFNSIFIYNFVALSKEMKGKVLTGKCKYTFALPESETLSYVIFRLAFPVVSGHSSDDFLEFSNIKLEEGSTATDWSPAPEDIDETYTPKKSIISVINQTAETVAIGASKINLNGVVTANDNFKILTDGSMVAKNGSFIGTVDATSLKVERSISFYNKVSGKATPLIKLALADMAAGTAYYSLMLGGKGSYIDGDSGANARISGIKLADDLYTDHNIYSSGNIICKKTCVVKHDTYKGEVNSYVGSTGGTVLMISPNGFNRWQISSPKSNYLEVSNYDKSTNKWNYAYKFNRDGEIVCNRMTVGLGMTVPSIELKTNTPYIDFHYKNSSSDYTARIIAESANQITVVASNGLYISSSVGVGKVMHGRDNYSHSYGVSWDGALHFFVDTTLVANVSDRRLKKDIMPITEKYIDAVGAVDIVQYRINRKIYNDDINFGAIAQDLRKSFTDHGLTTEGFKLLGTMQDTMDNPTLYYTIDYEQFLIARVAYDEKRIKKVETTVTTHENNIQTLFGVIAQLRDEIKALTTAQNAG